MSRVADILASKGSQVHSTSPETSVYQAIATMVQHNLGSLLVLRGDTIVGIFTERDHLRRVTLQDLDPHRTRVREVMTEKVIVVDRQSSIDECMRIMTRDRIRHLPVVERDMVVGMISIGDVVRLMSEVQAVEIRSLTEYITGAQG